MAPISGIGTIFGISEEATYGTPDAAVDNYLYAHEGFESLELTRELIENASLHGRSLDRAEVSKGRLICQGDIETAATFEGAWTMFLAHCAGKAWATAGAGPYTHTLDLGAQRDMAGKGITVFLNRQGDVPAGGAQQHVYSGFRPQAVELVLPANGHVMVKAEGVAKNLAFGALTSMTAPGGSFLKLPSNAGAPTPVFTWGGTSYVTQGDITLRIEQPHQLRYAAEDDLMLEPHPSGLMKITMSLTVEALATAAASGGAFYDDYKSKTLRAAVLTVDGATPANESLQASFGKCLITSPVDPHPDSGEIQTHSLELTAYRDGGTSAGQIVLTSGASVPYAA